MPGDLFQCLETSLVISTGGEVLLEPSLGARMLPSTLHAQEPLPSTKGDPAHNAICVKVEQLCSRSKPPEDKDSVGLVQVHMLFLSLLLPGT